MRCVLHIGTEKTGSTAIQQFLHDNVELLRGKGVHVCQSGGEPNNRGLPAAFMAEDQTDDFLRGLDHRNIKARRRWKKRLLKAFEKELKKARKKSDVFVISSEHFHSRLYSTAEVNELSAFLKPLFDKIEVICYLRRQDQMAVSRYSQALRAGHVLGAPVPRADRIFQGHLPPYFDFEPLLDRWAEAFGESALQPHIYSSDSLLDGNVVHDFLHKTGLGFEAHEMPAIPKANSALSGEAQTVLLGVNKSLDTRDRTQQQRQQYRRLVKFLDENAQGVSLRPEKAEAQAFYQVFRSSNRAVAQRWFNREGLFNQDFSMYSEAKPDINPQDVAALLAEFMLREGS